MTLGLQDWKAGSGRLGMDGRHMRRNPYLLISLPFLALGLFVAGQALLRLYKARESVDWPTVPGSVSWSDLEEKGSIDGGPSYVPNIGFTYTVDDQPYESYRYTFARRATSSQGYAEELVEVLPVKTAVIVYYNPRHPEEAVLHPGETTGLGMEVVTGCAFLVIGGFAIVRGWYRSTSHLRSR